MTTEYKRAKIVRPQMEHTKNFLNPLREDMGGPGKICIDMVQEGMALHKCKGTKLKPWD